MDNKEKRRQALNRQIKRLQHRLDTLEKLSQRYSYLRLLFFLVGFVTNGIAFLTIGAGWLWLTFLVAAVIFLSTVFLHNRTDEVITRYKIWLELTQAQTARMALDWNRIPPTDLRPDNALALDLDLTGRHSLHRLVNTAVSPQGSIRLKEWLTTSTPDPNETIERQQRVRELVNRPLFRKRLLLNGTYARGETESTSPERLLQWLQEQRSDPNLRKWVLGLGLLAAVNALLFFANLLGLLPPLWQGTLVVYVVLVLSKSINMGEPFKEASHLRDVLEQLLAVFRQLEIQSYHRTPHLGRLCEPFRQAEQKPSQYLRRLNWIVNATGLRRNPMLAVLLNVLFPYDIFFAYQLQSTRQALVGKLPGWMNIWFELEALGSLANLAYLNPHYTFPAFDEDSAASLLQARQMGHPLLPYEQKICNNFSISQMGFIGILTGSNMSGKSTFLRTVGINLALAYSGGPVDAELLQVTFFRLHTCIEISDSITTGISHFYAEVKCLKSLMNQLETNHPLPLLYLIDEIFQGTNNRERLTGSRSFIRVIASKTGVGLITTHDLELAQLAQEIPSLRNFHFKETVSNGRLHFDFKIQPGPSPTTNALKIMEMEGLPINLD